MRQLWKRIWKEEAIRYLFFGGCTTGVNLLTFVILRYMWKMPVNMANLLSICTAVVFAFWGNRYFVFLRDPRGTGEVVREFVHFAEMRFGTLGIEFFGVIVLNKWMGLPDFSSKLLIQIVVIILNYVISKFVIFTDKQAGGVANE